MSRNSLYVQQNHPFFNILVQLSDHINLNCVKKQNSPKKYFIIIFLQQAIKNEIFLGFVAYIRGLFGKRNRIKSILKNNIDKHEKIAKKTPLISNISNLLGNCDCNWNVCICIR